MKYQTTFFFLVASRKPALLHSPLKWTELAIRQSLFIVQTKDRIYAKFAPILQFFLQDNITEQIAVIQYSGRASLPQQII